MRWFSWRNIVPARILHTAQKLLKKKRTIQIYCHREHAGNGQINSVQNLNFDWHIIKEMQQEVSSKSCKFIFMGSRPEEDLEPELARKEEEGSGWGRKLVCHFFSRVASNKIMFTLVPHALGFYQDVLEHWIRQRNMSIAINCKHFFI